MKKLSLIFAIALALVLALTLFSCGSENEDECRHEVVVDEAIPATCITTGLTEGSHCAVCGKVLVAQEEVPETEEHTPVTDEAIPATCKEAGWSEGSHCGVCNIVLVSQMPVAKLKHSYNQKKVTANYLKAEATTSSSATYYYSCVCGSRGNDYFSYGKPLSETNSWTPCNKTVYGFASANFYTNTSGKYICGKSKVGIEIPVVSTNGEWYKVSEKNIFTNCEAYIKCTDVTEDASLATFVKIPEEYANNVSATVRNQFVGAYLCSDISEKHESRVGLIYGSGYITVASINKSRSWVAVYYYGTDSEGRQYDGSKLYYCSLDELAVLGLPDSLS